MANTKKPEDEIIAPKLPDMSTINKGAVDTASANLSAARGALNNMSYDTFKQGTLYDGLKKSYEQQGKKTMQDTLGQVAARTGGMASSYATSAANQSYNNYMQTLEDAARAMYNDEYSKARDKVDLAQQGYNNAYGEYRDNVGDAWTRYNAENDAYWKNKNYNYQVGRDEIEDKRYEDSQTKERVDIQKKDLYDLVASGGTPNRNDYPDLTDADYKNIVATATGNRTDANRKTVDSEFETLFGAEDFDWNKYDWNGDGKVDKTDSADAYDFSGSSYGADYWQQYWRDAQQGYADADTKEAQDEVMAILQAGGTPTAELLVKAGFLDEESAYSTDEDGNGIPDGLSGLAATMWQNNIDSKTAADTKEAEERVLKAWSTGVQPSDEDLKLLGYMDSDGSMTPAGTSAKFMATGLDDTSFELLISGEDFDWDNYDWDGDGKYGVNEDGSFVDDDENIDGAFINSELGKEWWHNFYTDTQNERAETAKKEAQSSVHDVWGMGKTPSNEDLVAAGYMDKTVDGDGNVTYTINSNGELAKSYYWKPAFSKSEVTNSFMTGGKMHQSEIDAFDYYYGTGAYSALSDALNHQFDDLSTYNAGTLKKEVEQWIKGVEEYLGNDAAWDLLLQYFPEYWDAATNKTLPEDSPVIIDPKFERWLR